MHHHFLALLGILALTSGPGLGLVGLIVIGGLAGWIAGMVLGGRHGIIVNIVIGIIGSWVGSALAHFAHIVVRHSLGHFVAALVGSIVLLAAWRVLNGRPVSY